ncbi:hypothetical protein AVEN_178334-1 [Araneus ventricosus]|uniref:Uncharacterized protein n=1 Tax=Araneus ventricosus TaxID=182803 RepID=A0A4Y2BFJ3_ARAVE|nr:hypothetical protein AVEN_178334-1 [Araneus ventricosus]
MLLPGLRTTDDGIFADFFTWEHRSNINIECTYLEYDSQMACYFRGEEDLNWNGVPERREKAQTENENNFREPHEDVKADDG